MGKVVASSKKAYDPASRSLPPLFASFYQRMKRQRVYPLVVRWGKGKGSESTDTPALQIRPIIPGALVVPAELPLEPGLDATATFHVTPVALGRLSSARVEVLHQGRNVDALPLKMRVVRWSIARVLFLLAFLVPLLLIFTTGDHKLTSDKKKYRRLTAHEQKASEARRVPKAGSVGAIPGKKGAFPKKVDNAKGAGKEAANDNVALTAEYDPEPGEVLADHVNKLLPKIPSVSDSIAWAVGEGYQFVCDAMHDQPQLTFYGTFLLFLVLSMLLCSRGRGAVRGQPLVLPRAPA